MTVVVLDRRVFEGESSLEGEGLERLSGQGIPVNISSSIELRTFFLAIKASILSLLQFFLRDLEWALFGGEIEELYP